MGEPTAEQLADFCYRAADRWRPTFEAACGDLAFRDGMMLPSEMMLFASLCHELGVTRVFESGRKCGYSTEVLCRWPDRWKVRSCERSPVFECDESLLAKHEHLVLSSGDGVRVLPRWLLNCGDSEQVAVLLDGPKGREALNLGAAISDRVVFWAQHDLVDAPPDLTVYFTTRTEEWAERHGDLDEAVYKYGGYASRAEMTAQSMGLAVFPGGRW